MRNPKHDYGRKNGLWWAEHGEANWGPDKYGERILVRKNGHMTTQAELLVEIKGILLSEQRDYDLWQFGDPKLPEPFSSLLAELATWSVERTMAEARNRDADWDVYEAAKNERRHGQTG